MKRFLACAVLAAAMVPGLAVSAKTTATMPACAAGDPVVWVNTKTKVYHMQGDPYYGNTKSGRYACKSTADAAGEHAPKSAKQAAADPAPAVTPGKKSKHHRKSTMTSATPDPAAT
jgi:ABC-type sugar transport system substrate-binding protein